MANLLSGGLGCLCRSYIGISIKLRLIHNQLKTSCSTFYRLNVSAPRLCTCSSPSGRLYVRPRRCRQHVWEQEDRLFVQSVAGGAQPAGTDLGETAENFPSHSPAVHPAAAQPGTDTHTNPAAQIDEDTETEGSGT